MNTAKKYYKKEPNLREAIDLFNIDLDQILKLKKLLNVFEKADLTLLRKLTVLDPHARFSAGLVLLPK